MYALGFISLRRERGVPPATRDGPVLTAEKKQALATFVQTADGMAAALSADDLAAFEKSSAPVMDITHSFTEAFRDRSELAAPLTKLDAASHFHGGAGDLKAARKAFHAFTMAATAALEPLRMTSGSPGFKVWQCPMVDQAVEGAPKQGRWIQLRDRPGANPFFGKEMLECAAEVKAN